MLTHLYIRDFAIVNRLELSLTNGLTVLTGETGTGKSIMIDALALLLGGRADNDVIRHGCSQAEVLASFDLTPKQDAAAWLAANDLFADRECVLRRVIYKDRPTKGFINGRPMPMQMLRQLGECLVDIHGQHEHQSLLKRNVQRQILDDYAGHTETVAALTRVYHELQSLQFRLKTLRRDLADRDSRMELLRYQVGELDALDLAADELPRLEEEHARLTHANELIEGIQAITRALYDDDEGTVTQTLHLAVGRLDSLNEYDPGLTEVSSLLNEAMIQVDEAAAQLRQYLDKMELDPQRLAWLEQRLGTVHDLARKQQVQAQELPAVLERLRTELADIEDAETNLEKLEGEIHTHHSEYQRLAKTVSANRNKAARRLAKRVCEQMQELGMSGGRFEVNLASLTPPVPTAHGLDQVEFAVSANPGQPLRPLAKVASGGELSRISLAIQVITAGVGRIPTLIFDEVDVGIGGRVAEIVGQCLRALGETRQVLCITHLAQVAAQGGQHLRVNKHNDPEVSVSIDPLDTEGRVEELARMIGGVTITTQTRAHAEDMLARASA